MESIVLENQNLHLEFNLENGALIGLRSVATGWEILNRPHLGLSFRLMVPMPGRRNNPVFGEKQKLSSFSRSDDGHMLTLNWENVVSEHAGEIPVKLIMQVLIEQDRAVFSLEIENRSRYVVENVYFPYLGDIKPPDKADWFKTFSYQYATAQEWSLYPTYDNLRGYYGVDYPTQYSNISFSAGAPTTPYFLVRSADEGLYAGIAEPSYELVAWHTELRPGYGSSIDSRLPENDTISGKDVATRFAAVHVPYIQPGEMRRLTPVALQAFQGGWQHGVDIYKTWRSQWMKLPEIPEWAREPHAWQQIHINSPEDELRVPFTELVNIGEECARHGVRAIQLVGWDVGGQDQGNPSHDPEPRLGTFKELQQAIADIQALGVRVILFAKFTWTDRATPRFRNDLFRLAIKDPYGDYYHYGGYQYQSATQLLDINTKRLIPMCFLSDEYLKLCNEEFRKTVELGADGILFDECLHHSPTLLCFDGSHGHRYGAPVYTNDNKLIESFTEISKPVREDFLFAGEACYDWEMGAYQLSYHRSENKKHIPLSRYMLPEAQFMTAVTGFNDRNMINQCLLYRYIISYEPYNFKGRLDDYPLTMAYGKLMDALRSELRAYFWDGEFRDKVGASVTGKDGEAHHPFSVFTNRQNGKSALVIANYEETESVEVQAKLDNGEPLVRYRLVDDPVWKDVQDGMIVLPPQSAAVVLPEGV